MAACEGERRYFFEFFTVLRQGTSRLPERTGCAFSTGESTLLKIIRRSSGRTVLMNGSGMEDKGMVRTRHDKTLNKRLINVSRIRAMLKIKLKYARRI